MVGPISCYDTAATYSAISGHAVGFALEWDRIKLNLDFACMDTDINAWKCGGEGHFFNGGGHAPDFGNGIAFAQTTTLYGVRCHALCNWMGDDGFLKRLTNRVNTIILLGDVLITKLRVTNKYQEGAEYLVDIEVNTENLDHVLLMTGTATVRLPSRSEIEIKK
jgi:hypothetical protein